MLHPGLIFVIALAVLVFVTWRLRWPLPFGLLLVSLLAALLAGFWTPFRHLVEGGFGYLNLVLALFAGAFFGQAMMRSGAADGVADRVLRLLGGSAWLVLLFAGALLYAVGTFVGIAGVAVLATGVFVVPLLRRIGLADDRIGAFIAVLATCGMVAPPVNVPAMTTADGVNMPYIAFGLPLLALSLPVALFTVTLFALVGRGPRPAAPPPAPGGAAATGFLCLVLVLGFWTLLRLFPAAIPDPAVPLVLVIGGLVALPRLGRTGLGGTLHATFAGTPLVLAAVLVTVGVALQIMALTGVRGWLVINAMSLPGLWVFVGLVLMPVFGGVLTSIGSANILGVPFAFALIGQDMIMNVSALSAIAALSEFMPPTAIAAVLSVYVVGGTSLWGVLKRSLWPLGLLTVLALLMLAFADSLTGILQTGGVPAQRSH